MQTRKEEGVPILVICDNVTIECPREQEIEREMRVRDRQREGESKSESWEERKRGSKGERNV